MRFKVNYIARTTNNKEELFVMLTLTSVDWRQQKQTNKQTSKPIQEAEDIREMAIEILRWLVIYKNNLIHNPKHTISPSVARSVSCTGKFPEKQTNTLRTALRCK